jgi:leucine dehydrogenase
MGVIKAETTDEQVIFFQDSETGLRGITVLDSGASGPTVGSCRRRPYDDEERALSDALRQARTTAAKAALAGMPVGGGCTVFMNDPAVTSPRAQFQALGRALNDLNGRYVLMPDPDETAEDMDNVARTTAHVLGTSGYGKTDPAVATAKGVLRAIELSVRYRLGRDRLSGVRVAIMGLGPAGYQLAAQLRLLGAKLVVADRDPRRTERAVRELGIACVATEEIIHLDTDVFAPCSAKDAINGDSLAHLRCSIVAGTADDVLQLPAHGQGLHERGILYAPDVITTAGGLISLVDPLVCVGTDPNRVDEQIAAMVDRLGRVFDQAAEENRPTSEVAGEFLQRQRSSVVEAGALPHLALVG